MGRDDGNGPVAAGKGPGVAEQLAGESAGLGLRLRRAREAQRLTLAQLAAKSGLTKGFLSKIERGVATPSVASLLRLCEALGLSVGALFDGEQDRALIRATDYPRINFGGEKMVESLLTPMRERRIQVIHSVIEPSGGSGDETYELPADVEFVFVVSGELSLTIDDELHLLHPGDALTFAPSLRHSFHNRGPRSVEVLWVLTPALPIGGSSDEPEIERT